MSFQLRDISSYWTNPYELNNLLTSRGLIGRVYAAMEKEDVSHLVMTAYYILQEVGLMPIVCKENKSASESAEYRNVGNVSFTMGELDSTMASYNRSLKYAPKNSEEAVLALNNRSALLFKLKCFEACMKDIDTCFSLKCPDRITEKLRKRREECSQLLWHDLLMNKTFDLVDDYFKFSVKRHPEINCASTDIDVVIEDGIPKVVAAKDINVGTVIAIETPYMTHIGKHNYDMACYYCHKFALNLIPCDGCVAVLFCSNECKKTCMDEYHEIECKIMELLEMFSVDLEARLALKSALKIKSKCSWKKFVNVTNKMGMERMRDTPVSEIFDGKNVFSMLSYNESNAHIVHGTQYNFSFYCAAVLKALENHRYFPHANDEKLNAMQAFAKVVMNLKMFFPRILMGQTAKAIATEATGLTPNINSYLLSFSSRLKHNCEANALLLPLLNNVAVATQRPIKKGDEITISYPQHYYHIVYNPPRVKNILMYRLTQKTCTCRVCVEQWNVLNLKNCKMSSELRRTYHKWRKNVNDFKATCQAMEAFDSVPNTKEHYAIYKQFIVLQNFNQFATTRNVLPSKLRPDIMPDQHRVFM